MPGGEEGRHEAVAHQGLGFVGDLLGDFQAFDLALGLAHAGDQVLLELNQGLNRILRELQRLHKVRFGDFLGRSFIHDQVLLIADIDEIQIALVAFGMGRIDHELAVDAPEADGSEGAVPRDIADHQGRRGTDDAEYIGIVLAVGAQDDALDLYFIEPPLGEEGANRPVGQAAGEDFLLRGATFTLKITSGKPARRSGLFPVIHGQREKFLVLFSVNGSDGRHDNDGFAELNSDGAIGLLGNFARLNCDLFIAHEGSNFF